MLSPHSLYPAIHPMTKPGSPALSPGCLSLAKSGAVGHFTYSERGFRVETNSVLKL